jgi:hypothetical protein
MKKLVTIILLCTWNFLSYSGEDPNHLFIQTRPENNKDDTELEIENPFAQENLLIVFDNENVFSITEQFGYGNIFTRSSFMHGAYLGCFVQYENKKFSDFISFRTGLRIDIYFADYFEINDFTYTLKSGICANFPTIVLFNLLDSGLSKMEKKVDLFVGLNPKIFEIHNPLFILNATGGIRYTFYKSFYLMAAYEHSINQRFAVNEVNVGIGFKF